MPKSSTIPSNQEKIEAFFERFHMEPEDRIIVAFSGGPDSTYLLTALLDILGPKRLIAAHFNHCLRGDESLEDAIFCERFAYDAKTIFETERSDVTAYAKERRMGIEEAARELRYGFLERVRQKNGARFIATGHTADDLAETVLLRLAKGTKIRGLKGIPEVAGAIVRPMLSIAKTEILSELAKRNVSYRTDSSNSNPSFERNRIRLSVLPELVKINPSVRSTLTDFSKYAEELDAFLENSVSTFVGTGDSFGIQEFRALEIFLAKEVLWRLYCRFNGTGVGLSSGMVEEMFRFTEGVSGGKEKAFGSLVLRRSKGRIFFGRNTGRQEERLTSFGQQSYSQSAAERA